jgi:hypothetical protein
MRATHLDVELDTRRSNSRDDDPHSSCLSNGRELKERTLVVDDITTVGSQNSAGIW